MGDVPDDLSNRRSGVKRPTFEAETSVRDSAAARLRILHAAVAVIDHGGDTSLRMQDVADAVDATPALISYYFGGREGLIAAAHAERFRDAIADDVQTFESIMNGDGPPEEIALSLAESSARLVSRELTDNRLCRITVLAATHGRPGLRAEIAEMVGGTIDAAERMFEIGKSRGFFRSDIHARAAATVMISVGLGHVISDLDTRRPDENDLKRFIRTLLGALQPVDRDDPEARPRQADVDSTSSATVSTLSPTPDPRNDPSVVEDAARQLARAEPGRVSDRRARILDAAVDAIDRGGQASLRFSDIATEAGVNLALISHHFGRRDDLIAAAEEIRFQRQVGHWYPGAVALMEQDRSHQETVAILLSWLAEDVRKDRAAARLERVTALAAVHGRPELRATMSERVSRAIDGTTAVYELGQAKGYYPSHINPRAAATFATSASLGYVISDFDPRPTEEDELVRFVSLLVDSIHLTEPPSAG
jgi:AcrR family transcriptional regulator